MRSLLQHVDYCTVSVGGQRIAHTANGLLIALGVAVGDDFQIADRMAERILELRILPAADQTLNRSLREAGGAAMVISQFTLCATVKSGRRPSYHRAAAPAVAEPLYQRVIAQLAAAGLEVQSGRFGAHMEVTSLNRGPISIIVDIPVIK